MLPCKVSCFHTLPLYRATTSLRKLRAAKAVVSYANYNWPGTISLWNKTHWCATVPQKTAAASEALREANRRDAASNEELEKKKEKKKPTIYYKGFPLVATHLRKVVNVSTRLPNAETIS